MNTYANVKTLLRTIRQLWDKRNLGWDYWSPDDQAELERTAAALVKAVAAAGVEDNALRAEVNATEGQTVSRTEVRNEVERARAIILALHKRVSEEGYDPCVDADIPKPDDGTVRLVLDDIDALFGIARVECSVCHELCVAEFAHVSGGRQIGDECCWDDRLYSAE